MKLYQIEKIWLNIYGEPNWSETASEEIFTSKTKAKQSIKYLPNLEKRERYEIFEYDFDFNKFNKEQCNGELIGFLINNTQIDEI